MDNIKYDSVYKFAVSLGVILLASPLFILYLIYTGDIPLISQTDYDALSDYSKGLLDVHLSINSFIFKNWLWLTIVVIVAAIALWFFGIPRWLKEDRERLNKKEIETTKTLINEDVVDNAAIESHINQREKEIESDNELDVGVECLKVEYPYKYEVTSYKMARNLFFEYAIKDYLPNPNYSVQLDKKINNLYYDAIAISEKADNPDIIYEFKWWHEYKNKNAIYSSAKRLEISANNYQAMTGRQCEKRLVIVTADEYYNILQDWLMETMLEWPNDSSKPIINIQIVSEDSLYPYYEDRMKRLIEDKIVKVG